MKLRLSLKLIIYILPVSIAIYAISMGYISIRINNKYYQNALAFANEVAVNSANKINLMLNSQLEMTRTLKVSLKNSYQLPEAERQALYMGIATELLHNNSHFEAVAFMWELQRIDSTYQKPYGRRRYAYTIREGKVLSYIQDLDMDGDDYTRLYYALKTGKMDVITDPYYFSYPGTNEKLLETSFAVPVVINDNFYGLVNVDVLLDKLNAIINDIEPFEGSYAVLLSNNGTVVAHPNQMYVDKPIGNLLNSMDEFSFLQDIERGNQVSFNFKDSVNTEYYARFLPLIFDKVEKPWAFGLIIPRKVMIQDVRKDLILSLLLVIVGLSILSIIIYLISKTISRPLVATTGILGKLSEGSFSTAVKLKIETTDEIGSIGESVNKLIDGLNHSLQFAERIGKGDYQTAFNPLSKSDDLGNALLNMRESLLKAASEEEKRRDEDRKLSWATEGSAHFGDILRQYANNMEDFSFNIISNIVKYIGANQGGLFVLNDEDKENTYLELSASYAYDRRKVLQKKIQRGVGLVGRCLQEGDLIYMTNLPSDYLNIGSGLGERAPGCLLIVPFKFNDVIYAIAEIAAFTELEPYKIQFVVDIGNSIASTIATVKINVRTNRLVEELKVQSEELASQEEEMRQNIEEMMTTQEELSRKTIEYENLLRSFYEAIMVIEYDLNGKVLLINDKALKFLQRSREEVIGTYQGKYSLDKKILENSEKFWNQLQVGRVQKLVQHIKIEDNEYWISELYYPIENAQGKIYKVLNVITNISDDLSYIKKSVTL